MSDYLSKKARSLIGESDEVRIESIKSPRWIGYDAANDALQSMKDLMEYPKTHRMPNLLIVGETNNGKTAILRRFEHLNQDEFDPSAEFTKLSVFYMQCPSVPDERRFLANILNKLGVPVRKNERADNMTRQVIHFFRQMGVKILLLDEIQHILAGPLQKQRILLNTIKYLGNELEIPIIAAGVREAFNALNTDPQLANRFTPFAIPRWKMDKNYRRLLKSFEVSLPLKQESRLHDSLIAGKLLTSTEGSIGELSNLLRTAGEKAIRSGEEKISLKLLESIGWIQPSKRRIQAAKII